MPKHHKCANPFTDVNQVLLEGLQRIIQTLEKKYGFIQVVDELLLLVPLLEKIDLSDPSIPPAQSKNILYSLFHSINTILTNATSSGSIVPEDYGASLDFPLFPVIHRMLVELGPEMEISVNQMVVLLSIPKDFSWIWTPQILYEFLAMKGIQKIDKDAIDLAIKHPGSLHCVAKGSNPVSGKDATLTDHLAISSLHSDPPASKNRNEARELPKMTPIAKGQIIFNKNPAVRGIPGCSIFGEQVSARDGDDIEFPTVINTELSENRLMLSSAIEGIAYKDRDQIIVKSTESIPRNANSSGGYLESPLTLHVKGDALQDAHLESKQEVAIDGIAEACTLIAKKNIFLPEGMQGNQQGELRSGENIDAKFLNEAQVTAKETITVHGPVILSTIQCNRLSVDGKDAEIIGGTIEAGIDVVADTIGSETGTKTAILLGYGLVEAEEKRRKAQTEFSIAKERVQQFEDSLFRLKKKKAISGTLSSNKERLQEKLTVHLKNAKSIVEEKEANYELAAFNCQLAIKAIRTIRARKQIWPGVEITISGYSFSPQVPTGPATILLVNDTITVLPFQQRFFEEEAEDEIE